MIKYLKAYNFSGRSEYLKKWSGFGVKDSPVDGAYIGELANDYISGLATNVADELSYHNRADNQNVLEQIIACSKEIGMDKYFDQNPFQLSGGEMAMLSLLSGLVYSPSALAIDSTLEQLSPEWRGVFLDLANDPLFSNTEINISDNRLKEYSSIKEFIEPEQAIEILGLPSLEISFKSVPLKWKDSEDLTIENLRFGYKRKKPVLTDCNFTFRAGNIYHLKGQNGAGKSTLSKILCGLYKPNAGSIYYGKTKQDAFQHPGKILGYSFQNPDDQIFNLTVEKELIGARKNLKVDSPEHLKFIKEVFALSHLMEEHPADLPFVLRKRLTLASTVLSDRAWLIFDEPNIGQDDNSLTQLVELFEFLADSGKGVVIISHSESFIQMFNNINRVELKDGKLNVIN